ncbi:MAG: glycosyltransferase [Bacteroidota bacterium]|nr:glycosyltransferase [Bacteroidota bacterium]
MSEKKKILVFIDWYLPGYKAGGPIQSCNNLIENLKEEFDFSVITRDTDYCEEIPYKNIPSNQWVLNSSGVRVYYISKDKLFRKTIKQLILSEDFDIVYLNGIYSLYFVLIPLFYLKRIFSLRLAFKTSEKKVIVAARGMLAKGAVSVKRKKKTLFIKSSRIIGLFNNVIFHATSKEEQKDINTHFGAQARIKLAPNLPKKTSLASLKKRNKAKGNVKIVNIARIAPEKGLLYAIEILANVKEAVSFDIYGPVYDEKYWEKCQKAIKKLPSNIAVNYKGSTPSEEIDNVLINYHFMFMPTKGENFGHVILESLLTGCPVIISDKTPWQNLSKSFSGWDISLNDIKTFSKVIETTSQMDQKEYDSWSKGAYKYATEFIDNKEVLKQNIELFGS